MAQIKVTWNLEQPINQNEIDRLVDVDAKMADGDLADTLLDEAHPNDVDWAIDLRFDLQVQSHADVPWYVHILRTIPGCVWLRICRHPQSHSSH